MVVLMYLGFNLSVVDGFELKICHYRHDSLSYTVNMAIPKEKKCLRKIVLKGE